MSRTAFVTGGSGFIGGALVRRLVGDGWNVRALARSDEAAAKTERNGATPVRGDMLDSASLRQAAAGAEVAFHAAAHLGDWGAEADFVRGNVTGTQRTLEACRRAGVERFVLVGTEAALLDGDPLVMVDEREPLRLRSKALYSRTKAEAEALVLAAAGQEIETVVVRPRLVWGPGDSTILPGIAEAVRSGRFAWIGGGRHRTSTTHVENAVEGLVLAAERGVSGSTYFVTDGEPVVFRDFITRLLATEGLTPPGRSIPRPVGALLAAAGETAWRLFRLKGQPPLTRLAFWLSALETTIDISKARAELGYVPVVTVDEGLDRLLESRK